MRSKGYMDFGEEIGKTVQRVLNAQDFSDLKNMINNTMRNVPGMGGRGSESPVFWEDDMKLSDDDPEPEAASGFADGSGPGTGSGSGSARGARPGSGFSRGAGTGSGFGSEAASGFSAGSTHRSGQQAASQRRSAYRQAQKPQWGSRISSIKGQVLSILLIIAGVIGMGLSGVVLVSFLVMTIMGYRWVGTEDVKAGIVFLCIIFLCAFLFTVAGIRIRKQLKWLRRYLQVLSGRKFCEIKELSDATGKKSAKVIKDLKKMIGKGFFMEGYLDKEETCFMVDYETYSQYLAAEESAKRREAEQAEEETKWDGQPDGQLLKQTIEEGKSYVEQIKAANDALPEAEITEKLNRLEKISSQIFKYVAEHPDKLPEIRKLMRYYMPITLKLVTAYQEFDSNGSVGDEVEATKKEIEGTLDKINGAYLNLLKKLMEEDMLDVSSDISALNTILAQEGLTDNDWKGEQKQ